MILLLKITTNHWYLKTIKAPEAWDISRGSDKITVAIVDNGFNLSHPELKSKVVSLIMFGHIQMKFFRKK